MFGSNPYARVGLTCILVPYCNVYSEEVLKNGHFYARISLSLFFRPYYTPLFNSARLVTISPLARALGFFSSAHVPVEDAHAGRDVGELAQLAALVHPALPGEAREVAGREDALHHGSRLADHLGGSGDGERGGAGGLIGRKVGMNALGKKIEFREA